MKFKIIYILLAIILLLTIAVLVFMNLPRFGRLPQGERLKRMEMSPNYRSGEFRNLSITPHLTSGKSRLRMMFDFMFEKREANRPDKPINAVKTDLKNLSTDRDFIVWFGHSSYLLQINGKRMLIDPVFYYASPVSLFNRPFRGADIYKPEDMPDVDYLIITHDHWDHLDYKTVTKLKNRVGRVICPLGVGEHFEYWGYDPEKLVEMDWNQRSELSTQLEIYCLPTRHFSGRSLKANQTLWASYMIKTPSRNIYISGDGGYDNHFSAIARQFPTIDLAIMENGQYDKNWRYIHLMPDDLVKAIKDLNPRNVITGHNSKFAMARHSWDEPINKITAAAARDSLPLLTPVIGEVLFLN